MCVLVKILFNYHFIPKVKAGLADMEEEIGTLFVGDAAVCIIWIFTFVELNDEPLIFRPIFVLLQRIFESFVSNEVRKCTMRW